jgi:hypothetical protein
MTTEFDIDTPADLELLGGSEEEEIDPEQQNEAEEEQQEESAVEEQEIDEEEPAPPKRDPVIPRARFDEVNAKLHAAREEAEQLRAALAAQQEQAQSPVGVDLDDLENKYFDAFHFGEKEEATKIRSQINAHLAAMAEATSAAVVSRQLAEQAAEAQFQQVVKQAVTVYPFLDIASKSTNEAAIAEVLSWRGMYEAQGHSKANALAMAVNKVGPYYHRPAQEQAEEPPVDTRKQKAMRLAAETAVLQPPRVDDGVGTRAIPVSKEILGNQDKWERASESERMRFLQ